MHPPLLTEQIRQELAEVGDQSLPHETGGILLPEPFNGRWVIPIPNRAESPVDRFEFDTVDMREALFDWLCSEPAEELTENLTIWHTHPAGGVGPSRLDMQQRVLRPGTREPMVHHLVMTRTQQGWIPAWY